jgi:hypothetical protein
MAKLIFTTDASRRLSVDVEVIQEFGRVVYTVAKVGTFTIERDAYESNSENLFIHYGRHDTASRYRYDDPLPEAPVFFGITLIGGAGFDPVRFTDPDSVKRWYTWPARRQSRGSVPDATAKRAEEICRFITLDYLERDDYPAIERARARHLAPGRLAGHQCEIDRLRGEIATRQAQLAEQIQLADQQATLINPAAAETAAA